MWLILAIAMLVMLVIPNFAGAETLEFSEHAAAGDVLHGAIDIVEVGGYVQGNYQYFYFETRDPINSPSTDTTHVATIRVEADVNGEDIDSYVVIAITWDNDNGELSQSAFYTTSSGGYGTLAGDDLTISGTRVTARVPATLFQNVGVYNVEFATSVISSSSGMLEGDSYTYYTNPSGSGGSSNDDGTGDNSYTEPDVGIMAMASLAYIACGVIWLVVWLLLAFWAYKDAKAKCMDTPIIWFLVVFLLGIIGIIIYIIIRKDKCQESQGAYVAPPPPPS